MLFKPTCAQISPHLSLIFLHLPVLEKTMRDNNISGAPCLTQGRNAALFVFEPTFESSAARQAVKSHPDCYFENMNILKISHSGKSCFLQLGCGLNT